MAKTNKGKNKPNKMNTRVCFIYFNYYEKKSEYINAGKVGNSLENLRWNQNITEMLSGIHERG
jgi:hypothetical protein